jgi:RNA-binding protein FUS
MVGNDWECDTCGNDNFSWRKSCKRCNKPKSKVGLYKLKSS